MDWIIGIAALFHLISSPFTKVEESFNIQACHDVLYHGWSLYEYDHLEFSGAVPRTFIGPLVVSFISMPIVSFFKLLGLSKFYSQYVVRFVLGSLVVLSWRCLRLQVQRLFGKPLAIWFTFITASQFHFIYYLSRPLPNVFALIFALLSFSFWLQQRHKMLILCSGIAVFIFRSELCLLLGPMLLYDLSRRKIHIVQFLRYAIPFGLLCLAATMIIDSIFWLRLVWPEGEVFWFNTYKNQSHQWGVYPFLWYWYSCLPRALGLSLLLVPVGIAVDPRVRALVSPGLLFVAIYSFLPHKELRFIIYVFPLFNIAVARACQFFWANRLKSAPRKFLAIASCLHIVANLVFTSILLTISSKNYPGGLALQRFHELVPEAQSVHLHIDNFAAQTGVTRFAELHSHWRYNKTEHMKAGGREIRTFTHLLVEAKSKYAYNLKHYTISHGILDSVDAFSHLSFNYLAFPPVKVRVKPAIFLLTNFLDDDIDWSYLSAEEAYNEDELVDRSVDSEATIGGGDALEASLLPAASETASEGETRPPAKEGLNRKRSSSKSNKKSKKRGSDSDPQSEPEMKADETPPLQVDEPPLQDAKADAPDASSLAKETQEESPSAIDTSSDLQRENLQLSSEDENKNGIGT